VNCFTSNAPPPPPPRPPPPTEHRTQKPRSTTVARRCALMHIAARLPRDGSGLGLGPAGKVTSAKDTSSSSMRRSGSSERLAKLGEGTAHPVNLSSMGSPPVDTSLAAANNVVPGSGLAGGMKRVGSAERLNTLREKAEQHTSSSPLPPGPGKIAAAPLQPRGEHVAVKEEEDDVGYDSDAADAAVEPPAPPRYDTDAPLDAPTRISSPSFLSLENNNHVLDTAFGVLSRTGSGLKRRALNALASPTAPQRPARVRAAPADAAAADTTTAGREVRPPPELTKYFPWTFSHFPWLRGPCQLKLSCSVPATTQVTPRHTSRLLNSRYHGILTWRAPVLVFSWRVAHLIPFRSVRNFVFPVLSNSHPLPRDDNATCVYERLDAVKTHTTQLNDGFHSFNVVYQFTDDASPRAPPPPPPPAPAQFKSKVRRCRLNL